MLKKSFIIIFMVIMASFAIADDSSLPEWVDFDHGKYLIGFGGQENAMIIMPDKPLTTERLTKYGNIITDQRTRERSINTKEKSKVTKEGLEIYDLLSRLKTDDGWFAFSIVVIEYDRVTIIKYNRTIWADHLEKILAVFK